MTIFSRSFVDPPSSPSDLRYIITCSSIQFNRTGRSRPVKTTIAPRHLHYTHINRDIERKRKREREDIQTTVDIAAEAQDVKTGSED